MWYAEKKETRSMQPAPYSNQSRLEDMAGDLPCPSAQSRSSFAASTTRSPSRICCCRPPPFCPAWTCRQSHPTPLPAQTTGRTPTPRRATLPQMWSSWRPAWFWSDGDFLSSAVLEKPWQNCSVFRALAPISLSDANATRTLRLRWRTLHHATFQTGLHDF